MRNISDKSDISDMFDMSDMFEKNPKCIIEQNSQNNNIINSVPDCLPHYSESNERNQSMSLQNEQKYTEESNKGDNTPIQTISAIPEKKDDSESFDDLEDFLVSKDNFVNKEFLGKKRDKSKSKENKVTKNKLFKVIHLENFENEEENNKEFISAAEKVIDNKENDARILNYSNVILKPGSTEAKTFTKGKKYNEKEESRNETDDIKEKNNEK